MTDNHGNEKQFKTISGFIQAQKLAMSATHFMVVCLPPFVFDFDLVDVCSASVQSKIKQLMKSF